MTVASPRQLGRRVAGALSMLGLLLLASPVSAASPLWWTTREVLDGSSTPNDYAAATMGQLKWIATNAYAELDAGLPGGAGTNIPAVLDAWLDDGTNYVPVNVGQMKNLAALFYDRLIAHGYTNAYPWAEGSDSADYSIANVGQVRQLFSFSLDADEDGLPDWWELQHFGSVTQSLAAGDLDMDGYDNREELTAGTDPTNRAVLPGSVLYVSTTGSDTNAGTWEAPFQHIAAGIAAATNGMRVVVLPGSYMGASNRNLSLLGKAIGVVGIANGNFETILDADNAGRGFIFNSGETTNALVRNFAIWRGRAADGLGGGMLFAGASPTIQRCSFVDCHSTAHGAGVGISAGSPMLASCVFRGNVSTANGAAIYVSGSAALTLKNSLVDANTAEQEGAVFLGGSATALLVNNTFTHNFGPAIVADDLVLVTNLNAIIAFNGVGIRQDPGAQTEVRTTCAYGNADGNYVGLPFDPTGSDGNTTNDPHFVDHEAGNLRLESSSPCRGTANAALLVAGDLDAGGALRLNGQRADMGGYLGRETNDDQPVVYHIKVGGSANNDGLSWASPFPDLATALSNAEVSNSLVAGGPVELRVAGGVYPGGINYTYSRGVVRGGYRGEGPEPDEHNPWECPSIFNGGYSQRVFNFDCTASASPVYLEHVTIERGYASSGGAIRVGRCAPVISHCILQDNTSSSTSGGAVSGQGTYGTLTLDSCVITNNTGCALAVNRTSGDTALRNCTIARNTSSMSVLSLYTPASITIANCTIVDNTGSGYPAVLGYPRWVSITNSIVWGNATRVLGSADIRR